MIAPSLPSVALAGFARTGSFWSVAVNVTAVPASGHPFWVDVTTICSESGIDHSPLSLVI